jgi:hypothetical protein
MNVFFFCEMIIFACMYVYFINVSTNALQPCEARDKSSMGSSVDPYFSI